MIQGGGHLPDLSEISTNAPVINESSNNISNKKGTIAMARTSDPHSATSQFFINLKERQSTSLGPLGWAVASTAAAADIEKSKRGLEGLARQVSKKSSGEQMRNA